MEPIGFQMISIVSPNEFFDIYFAHLEFKTTLDQKNKNYPMEPMGSQLISIAFSN